MLKFEELPKSQVYRIQSLWEKLNGVHFQQSVYFKDYYASFTFEKRMESILKKDENDLKTTLIIEDGIGRGYCLSTVSGQNGEVESLYVDEDLRGTGMGKTLVEGHVAWLKERGCTRIRLAVSYGNERVMEFYHKMGFFERLTYLEYKE